MEREIIPLGLPEPEYDPERDLSYWLESADVRDPNVLRVLYERYGQDVQLLALWLLSEGMLLDLQEVQRVIRRTFDLALVRLDGFRGQESARVWIASLALETIRGEKRRRFLRRFLRKSPRLYYSKEARPRVEARRGANLGQEVGWWRLSQLPEKWCEAVLLRYACKLRPAQIALILSVTEQQAHEMLNQARSQLLHGIGATSMTQDGEHPELCAQALAALDEMASLSLSQEVLDAHLETCPDCRSKIVPYRKLHSALPGDIAERWIAPELPLLDGLAIGQPGKKFSASGWRFPAKGRIWDIVLIGGVFAAVLFLVWNMIRQDTHRGRPIFMPTSGPMPTAQTIPVGRILQDPLADQNEGLNSETIFAWQPQLSADGSWLAYTRTAQKLVNGVPESTLQILLMDMQTRQSQVIGGQEQTMSGGYTFSPVLSADGRYLAYESNAMVDSFPGSTTYTCFFTIDETANCSDVLLYDRQSGETLLVSRALNGDHGNRNSRLPAISADGRYVAFWSAATNLSKEPSRACAKIDPANHCWDIYVRDMHTGVLQQVAVGRFDTGNQLPELGELSITENGRWVTLSIMQRDEIAPELAIFHSSEAYLYDLHEKKYILINQNTMTAGDPLRGNGASKAARVTADGSLVVFTSMADNLVVGDRNANADVFLLDRRTGLIELVSVASDGSQGDGPSGAFLGTLDGWGENTSISRDGRFVAFLSQAGNLAPEADIHCSDQGWFPCVLLAVRDRREHSTTTLVPPLFNAIYINPTLSADGQLLGLVHLDLECPRAPYCSAVLTYNLLKDMLAQVAGSEMFQGDSRDSLWLDKRLLEEVGKRVTCLDMMSNGQLLAGSLDDGGVILWEIESGAPYLRLKGREAMASTLAFSPDGTLLAVGWRDGHVAFYTMPEGELLVDLDSPAASVLSLDFSPDGEMLAVGGLGLAWTYEVRQHTFAILDFNQYNGMFVGRVAFSPDGRLVAHGLSDGSLWLRRSADNEVLMRLAVNGNEGVTALAFSPDGTYLADGGGDGQVNIWRLTASDDGKPGLLRQPTWLVEHILSLEHHTLIGDLRFSPRDETLMVATAANGLRVWDVRRGELLTGPFGSRWDSASALAFSQDAHYLAMVTSWGGVKIWEWVGDSVKR